jgi:ribosome-binding protein aMBF1 (putative translation factor)
MRKTKPRAKPETMEETLRRAIAESGLSFYRLNLETRVSRQSLMKFASGEQTLRLDHADALAAFFELELRPKAK